VAVAAGAAEPAPQRKETAPRAEQDARGKDAAPRNELTLARLRPGRDKLAQAVLLYGANYRRGVGGADDVLAWVDRKKHVVLRVELGKDGAIESVTISEIDPLGDEDGAETALPARMLAAGRGLALGDARARVVELYGEPGSAGPSTQAGRELELLFYSFDRAGADVPQVMEVTCELRTGRVVQMTLAFPSL
jgi:hypothetical protein